MSGLNIKLADLQISDFHAPECCFLWWHTEKTFSFWGRCPQTPKRGFAPGTHWGPTAAPRPPHHFPPFSLFPSPMSESVMISPPSVSNDQSTISQWWSVHHHKLKDLPLSSSGSVMISRPSGAILKSASSLLRLMSSVFPFGLLAGKDEKKDHYSGMSTG